MGYKFVWKTWIPEIQKRKIGKRLNFETCHTKQIQFFFVYSLYLAGSFCFNLHINRKLWFLFIKWNIHIFSTCDFNFHNARRKKENCGETFASNIYSRFSDLFQWTHSLSIPLSHSNRTSYIHVVYFLFVQCKCILPFEVSFDNIYAYSVQYRKRPKLIFLYEQNCCVFSPVVVVTFLFPSMFFKENFLFFVLLLYFSLVLLLMLLLKKSGVLFLYSFRKFSSLLFFFFFSFLVLCFFFASCVVASTISSTRRNVQRVISVIALEEVLCIQ